jgi:hypothetical protein
MAPPPWVSGQTLVGSQTDVTELRKAVADLLGSKVSTGHVTLLIPPLSQNDLGWFLEALSDLCLICSDGLTLVVNDLGTLVSLAEKKRTDEAYSDIDLELGTLLARSDDPREVAHFLSPAENPPRAIWGPDGEPRTLVYRKPPTALVQHWEHPSLFEPSARAALRNLTSLDW